MEKYVEALEALKSGFLDIADIEPYMETICKALEKQMPKKMSIKISDYMIQGYLYRDKCGYCPNCGEFRGNFDYQPHEIIKYKFCPDCGQALDWSGEDEENTYIV